MMATSRRPCKGMPSACLIFFAGLHDEFPDLPKLFAHVHGSCRNNVAARRLLQKRRCSIAWRLLTSTRRLWPRRSAL